MDELKPCPFCGGKAAIGHSASVYLDIRVYCKRCGAETGMYTSEIKAANAWNTRAERTCRNVKLRYFCGWDEYGCSECGCCFDSYHPTPHYCPNCGCKVVSE